MHFIWRRKQEFEDFIRKVASKEIKQFGGLYVLVAAVESYFELIVRALLDKIELTIDEKKCYKHGKAIDILYGEEKELCGKKVRLRTRLIDEQARNTFHEVRELRNDMLHDILYKPDLERLQTFVQKCFGDRLDPAEEERCKSSEEELERVFCNKIVQAYAKISNKYKRQTDEKIANYLETKL